MSLKGELTPAGWLQGNSLKPTILYS